MTDKAANDQLQSFDSNAMPWSEWSTAPPRTAT